MQLFFEVKNYKLKDELTCADEKYADPKPNKRHICITQYCPIDATNYVHASCVGKEMKHVLMY